MGDYKRVINPTVSPSKVVNLLKETVSILMQHNKRLDDIVFAGTTDGQWMIPLDTLVETFNIEYDYWYGEVNIDPRLIIRLDNDDVLTRWSSEGMEGWSYLHASASENAGVLNNIKTI